MFCTSTVVLPLSHGDRSVKLLSMHPIRVATTAYAPPLRENMASSTEPEGRNIALSSDHQRRSDPRPQATYAQTICLVMWFLADRTIGRAYGTVCRLSSSVVCRLLSSVTFCIVAKRCVLAKKCLKE